jgi:hypothetical protein
VPAPAGFPDATEGDFVSVGEPDVIDGHIKFASPCHHFLFFGAGDGAEGGCSPLDNDDVAGLNLFKNFEIDGVARL